jgi:hypothetical protein
MPLIQATVLVSAQSSERSQEIDMASEAMTEAEAEDAVEDAMPEKKGWREKKAWRPRQRPPQNGTAAGGGAVYGLGMIGALVYFFRSAQTGQDYVLAVPKAVVWPALLVYKLLKSFYG